MGDDSVQYIQENDAVRYEGATLVEIDKIESFVGGDAEIRDGKLVVATPQGALQVSIGSWVVKSKYGYFYSYKPDFDIEDEPSEIEIHKEKVKCNL